MSAHSTHDSHADSSDAFHQSFDADARKELLQEDSEAWHNVTGELLTIVTIGVLFFAFIVWIISR